MAPGGLLDLRAPAVRHRIHAADLFGLFVAELEWRSHLTVDTGTTSAGRHDFGPLNFPRHRPASRRILYHVP
jgi:hypothetical protein